MTQRIEDVSVMASKYKTKHEVFTGHRLKAAFITAATLTCLFGPAARAAGHDAPALFLPAGHQIAAPTAFLEMCARSPVDCERNAHPDDNHIVSVARQAMVAKYELAFARHPDPTPGAVRESDRPVASRPSLADQADAATPSATDAYARIDLDRDTLARIQAVNRKVNRDLIADTDAHVYKMNDYWDAPALVPGARGDCEDFALVKRRLLIEQGIPANAISLALVRTRFDEDHAVLVVSTLQGDIVLDNLAYSVKPWWKTGYTWISRQAAGDTLGWISLTPQPGQPVNMQVAAIR